MRILRTRFRFLAALALLVAVAGCEQGGDRGLSPTEPEPLLGLGGSLGGYTLANDPILAQLLSAPASLSKLIGINGGTIELLGHTLTVPLGAVSQPTLFVLTVLPTGNVEVYLLGTRSTLLGLLNIGSLGFSEPVPVTLTYSRSTNVTDPSKLFVLRAKGLFGQPQPLPSTVDTVTQTVTADLDHFSRYFLAIAN